MGRRSNGEGSIYKRKDGRWCGKYTVDGKRKVVYGKTRKEVAKKLLEAISKHNGGFASESEAPLKDYLERWLEDSVKHSVRTRTWERYEEITRKHLVPELGKIRMDRLTPAQVQGLYRKKLESGISARTVQYVHVTLHKVLEQAVRWGLVPVNVTQAVTPPKL